jgi:hypothetical protein
MIDDCAKSVLSVYREALKDVDTRVYNEACKCMGVAGATGFSDGWVAATVWMADVLGYDFDHESNLAARESELRKRYMCIGEEE